MKFKMPATAGLSLTLGHLGFPIGIKNINFVENLPMIIPGEFGFNCPRDFREECSLDGPLQTLRFLFRYEIQNGGYGRT
jgi:hypothetical protein